MDRAESGIRADGDRLCIERLAAQVFGDEDLGSRWMRAPCKALRGLSPRQALSEPEGAKTVEELLYRIDAGFSA